MTFAELTEQILAFRDARDWAQFHKPKDVAAAVAIEAAELQEHFLWKTHEESTEHLAKHGAAVAEEMGDLLFCVVNLARHLGVDAENALRQGNAKFERRFRFIEAQLREQGATVAGRDLAELDALWDRAKQQGL